jgi:signal transduction histidine kinase/FixJ family two-component response regulator
VLGGLFFGHPDANVFDANDEILVSGIAAQAAIAIDNARLYQAAQNEIAHRSETEAALRASEALLESRVAERTAELATANELLRREANERARIEEALRQAQKMESIGQLTGGVAHDFNNLLTIIMGNLETLRRQVEKDTPDVARLTRATQNAMTGAKRAAALTQQLLAFSRRQPLQPKPVHPNRLVSHMSDLLRRTLGEQIVIETVLAGGLWPAFADPNQLENAILNLAVNARDAMRGSGKLTIETANAHLDEGYATQHAEVVPGQYVVIAVTDTGSGMSREIIDHAFEPFFTTKDVGHGTGLGLSQVYGFVKQSGGHVKIYSEIGEGTSVKIYLPRLLHDFAAEEIGEEGQLELARGAAESILVVEDDDDVRAHSVDVLRELGYRVVEARTAEIALAALSRSPDITLLFTDVGLPGGMNGRQLADEVLRRRPDLKVLFTTGYARNAIVHEGRLDPGVQLITKPFTYEALTTKLRDMLDARDGPSRVLVIDDERLVREATVGILEELGFGADEAATAAEAMNKIRLTGDRFAAAIVDMGLPDRSGAALVAEMRALRANLAVIVATGDATSDLDGIRNDPNTAVLQKPYDPDQLDRALVGLGVRPSAEPDA